MIPIAALETEQDFECEITLDDGGTPPPSDVFDATFDASFE